MDLDLIFKISFLIVLLWNAAIARAEVQTVNEQDNSISVRTVEGIIHYLFPKELQGSPTYEILLQVSPHEFEEAKKAEEEKLRREAQVFAEAAHRYDKERQKLPQGVGSQNGNQDVESNDISSSKTTIKKEATDYLAKAYQLFYQEDYSEALQNLKLARELQSKDARIYSMLGSVYFRLGLLDEAKKTGSIL